MRLAILAFASLSFGTLAFAVDETTLTGQIGDSKCKATHASSEHGGAKLSAHDCVLACVKGGSKYVFVSNGKVYEIQNQNMPDLAQRAGETVQLTGELGADKRTLTVSKIAPRM